jgi:hypothetical protein
MASSCLTVMQWQEVERLVQAIQDDGGPRGQGRAQGVEEESGTVADPAMASSCDVVSPPRRPLGTLTNAAGSDARSGGLPSPRSPKANLTDLAAQLASVQALLVQRDAELDESRRCFQAEQERRLRHDAQTLPYLRKEDLPSEARKVLLEAGHLEPTSSVLPPAERGEAEVAMLSELLCCLRDNAGRKRTRRAQPEIVEALSRMLRQLMGVGEIDTCDVDRKINTCDKDPWVSLLVNGLPVAVLEDWKPPGPSDARPETASTIESAETRPAHVTEQPMVHLESYNVEAEDGKKRMSTTGMSAQLAMFEATGDAMCVFAILDILPGFLVADRTANPHRQWEGASPSAYQDLIERYFGPLIFHAILENPDYLLVNIRSWMVRESVLTWAAAQGAKALQLTDRTWHSWAGVSTASASESRKQQAWVVTLPARDALDETDTMPARPAREAMMQVWLFSQQGSRNACMGDTSGAMRLSEQYQLVAALFGRPKSSYSTDSPLFWLVDSTGPKKIKAATGIHFLTSSQAGGAKTKAAWDKFNAGETLNDAERAIVQDGLCGQIKAAWDKHDAGETLNDAERAIVEDSVCGQTKAAWDTHNAGGLLNDAERAIVEDSRCGQIKAAWDKHNAGEKLNDAERAVIKPIVDKHQRHKHISTPGCLACASGGAKHIESCPRSYKKKPPVITPGCPACDGKRKPHTCARGHTKPCTKRARVQ